jgi:hypothetical protein
VCSNSLFEKFAVAEVKWYIRAFAEAYLRIKKVNGSSLLFRDDNQQNGVPFFD